MYLVFESWACFKSSLAELPQGISRERVRLASGRPLSGKRLFAAGLAVLFRETATGRQHFRQPRSARWAPRTPAGVAWRSWVVRERADHSWVVRECADRLRNLRRASPEGLSALPPRPFPLTTILPLPPPGLSWQEPSETQKSPVLRLFAT